MAASDNNDSDNPLDAGSASGNEPSHVAETPAERAARIDRIRDAITRGEFDTEDLLEKAMRRMISRIESTDAGDDKSDDRDPC